MRRLDALLADLKGQASAARKSRPAPADLSDVMPDLERHR
jgi:hypothetical protein